MIVIGETGRKLLIGGVLIPLGMQAAVSIKSARTDRPPCVIEAPYRVPFPLDDTTERPHSYVHASEQINNATTGATTYFGFPDRPEKQTPDSWRRRMRFGV